MAGVYWAGFLVFGVVCFCWFVFVCIPVVCFFAVGGILVGYLHVSFLFGRGGHFLPDAIYVSRCLLMGDISLAVKGLLFL